MKKQVRNELIKYASAFTAGGLLSVFILSNTGFSKLSDNASKYRCLCDAFTIPGILLLMLGLMFVISDTGALNGLSYVFSNIKHVFLPFSGEKHVRYMDYVENRKARKRLKTGFLLITGSCFLACAVVFLLMFYNVYQK